MTSCQTLIITLFIIFSLITFSYAAFKLPKPKAIHLPIRKNATSLQYYTTYESGNPELPTVIDALIDLGAPSVWFDCTSYVSSSYKRASCGSNRCNKAKDTSCIEQCDSSHTPLCANNTCGIFTYNPFRVYLTLLEFGEDTMRVSSTDGQYLFFSYYIPKFQFSCSLTVEELPGDNTKGLVGLARTEMSLPLQISSFFKLPKKFAICLPSSTDHKGIGDLFIGGGPYYMSPASTKDESMSLVTTPLVVNPIASNPFISEGEPSTEYFINVKHIEVNGKRVAFTPSSLLTIDKKTGVGGTKISTMVPYTILHSSIYNALVNEFTKEASVLNIKRVQPVAPFGACFDSSTIAISISTGPAVPNIDLVLEGGSGSGSGSRMRVYGANSMVKVKKNVMCLAYIDGDVDTTSIVLGGYQLENYILEFDLTASTLGLSSSLLVSNTTCSHHSRVVY